MYPIILARFPDPTDDTATLTINVTAVDAVAVRKAREDAYAEGLQRLAADVFDTDTAGSNL